MSLSGYINREGENRENRLPGEPLVDEIFPALDHSGVDVAVGHPPDDTYPRPSEATTCPRGWDRRRRVLDQSRLNTSLVCSAGSSSSLFSRFRWPLSRRRPHGCEPLGIRECVQFGDRRRLPRLGVLPTSPGRSGHSRPRSGRGRSRSASTCLRRPARQQGSRSGVRTGALPAGSLTLAAAASLWVSVGVATRFGVGTTSGWLAVIPVGTLATLAVAVVTYGRDLRGIAEA